MSKQTPGYCHTDLSKTAMEQNSNPRPCYDETDALVITLKDSGQRREFKTGSVRDIRTGKGRFDLVPPEAIEGLAIQMELGASKYGERNWEKGQPLSSFLDSGLRHLNRVLKGDLDEDHLRAALWNIACAYATRERIKNGTLPAELNDLPNQPPQVPSI